MADEQPGDAQDVAPAKAETRVSYVLAGDRPLLIFDVDDPAHEGEVARTTDPLIWSFVERGFAVLPGFFDLPMPDDTPLRLNLTVNGYLALEDEGRPLTSASIGDLPPEWVDALHTKRAAIIVLGRNLGAATAPTARDAARAVDQAARAGRVVGAVVPLA